MESEGHLRAGEVWSIDHGDVIMIRSQQIRQRGICFFGLGFAFAPGGIAPLRRSATPTRRVAFGKSTPARNPFKNSP